MEITKENFNNKLGEIIDAIKKADFIAIDTEFTGLLTDDKLKRSFFDSGADVYLKERKNLKNVTICQLGLSAIKGDIEKNGYEAKTYNFYIMPKSLLAVDPNITCQSSSVEFLMQAGFDFRKWLLNGVPCLLEEDEQSVRREFKEMLSYDYNQLLPIYVLDQLAIVEAWRNKSSEDCTELSVFLRLPSFILHFLAAIYRRYSDVHVSLDADEVKLCIVKESKNKESLLKVIESSLEFIISENRGFVKVFDELRKDKIIVCHNGMLDLTLMFKQFYKSLPENYKEFKKELHEVFPHLYDTKRLARVIGLMHRKNENIVNFLSNTSLEAIKMELDNCNFVLHRPFISHSSLTPKYASTKCCYYHEAGYDAFCTAYCFVNLAHVLEMLKTSSADNHRPLSVMEHIGAVKEWQNEIPLQNGGISHVVLGGENPPMNRMNWIVVQNRKMLSHFATSQLNKLMAPFGRFESRRLSKTSFLVATFRKNSIVEAFRHNEVLRVSQYSPMEHSARLRGMTWFVAIVSSGISVWLMVEGIKSLQN